jgi:2-hydroxychromene-2-carboxylate isomerase
MARKNRPPRWYFSLRSPYSWFAYRELLERHPDVLDAVEWVPYWDPDAESQRLLAESGVALPFTPMTRAKDLYVLQDARRWSRARGWEMTWPVDRNPRWEVAHLPYLLAAAAGRGRAYVDAVYRARWGRGADVNDPTTIAEIAAEVGIDPAESVAAVDDPALRERGVACLAAAAADGLFGVPFFVHRHDRFWGVERVGAFAAMVRGEPVTEISELPWPDGTTELAGIVTTGADAGHAGGCG